MGSKELIERYKASKKKGVKLVDMDAASLAGYYLQVYPGGPVSALMMDMGDLLISRTKGVAAKELVIAARM